jgi:hypothetical protein
MFKESVFLLLALFAIATCQAGDTKAKRWTQVSPCQYNAGGFWKVGTAEGISPYCLKVSDEPVITCETVGWNPPSSFVADPFLVFSLNETGQEDASAGPWTALYEMMDAKDSYGKIGAAMSWDSGENWYHQGTVLDVGSHLSYPGVYDDPVSGKRVLIPSNNGASGIEVYETEKFPFGWYFSHLASLDGSYGWVDPTLVYWEGMWYCFVEKNMVGYLFYSPSLFADNWIQHPQSPFSTDSRYMRCGGQIVVYNGYMWRFSQDGSTDYGIGVHIFRIDTLTPTEFSETLLKSMMAADLGVDWAQNYFHHISTKEISHNEWYALVDGYT